MVIKCIFTPTVHCKEHSELQRVFYPALLLRAIVKSTNLGKKFGGWAVPGRAVPDWQPLQPARLTSRLDGHLCRVSRAERGWRVFYWWVYYKFIYASLYWCTFWWFLVFATVSNVKMNSPVWAPLCTFWIYESLESNSWGVNGCVHLKLPICFPKGRTNLCTCQNFMSKPITSHTCQHTMLFNFLILIHLLGANDISG